MNRYISYTLLVSAAVLAAACSNSEDMIGNELAGNESSNTPFSILGTSGGTVVNTDASYGEYTAYINVPQVVCSHDKGIGVCLSVIGHRTSQGYRPGG